MPFENLYSSEFRAAFAADANALLLDVRTAAEVADQKIDGSIHIDVMQPDFTDHISALDPSKNYYVYCRSGGRSSQACMMLAEAGFSGRLVNLAGGITQYDGPTV
jgi:rhodanese-related sulfurtransferase